VTPSIEHALLRQDAVRRNQIFYQQRVRGTG